MASSNSELGDSLVPKSSQHTRSLWFVYLAFLFPAFAGFLFGYDIGGASGAVASLNALSNATNAEALSTIQMSIFTSASLFGATLGSILVFWIGQPLGRRRELIIGSTLYMTGSLVSGLGPGDAITVIVGRAIYGFGIALSMHAAPVYISESAFAIALPVRRGAPSPFLLLTLSLASAVAPAAQRGLLVSLKEGFIVLGILCGFAVTALAENLLAATAVYRAIWAPAAVIGGFIVVGMSQMPPSPRWLLLRDAGAALLPLTPDGAAEEQQGLRSGRAQAAAALRRFRRGVPEAEIEAELSEIESTLAEIVSGGGGWGEILRARRALVAGIGLIALQQLTGQPSVLYYQVAIFQDAGFASFASSASVIIGGAKLVATLVTVAYVDRFGRRPLLFVGISMMFVALVLLAAAFHAGTPSLTDPKELTLPGAWPPLVVLALVLYVCGYQVGFGPIAWLIISEVFPLRSRTRALSLAVTANFSFNVLMTFTLEPLQQAFDACVPGNGQALLFCVYGVLCLVSLGFVYACVPETKGKTLEQIEQMFTS